jgi:hypothetical protein
VQRETTREAAGAAPRGVLVDFGGEAPSPPTEELDSSAIELEGQPTVIRFPVERVRRRTG